MRHHVPLLREASIAFGALEGLGTCVGPLVGDHGALLRERPITHLALEGSLARVSPLVESEVGFLREALPAKLTLERPLSGVYAHVAGEVAFLRKKLLALGALKRLLPPVNAGVRQKNRLVAEALRADPALVWALAGVNAHVPFQAAVTREGFVAIRAARPTRPFRLPGLRRRRGRRRRRGGRMRDRIHHCCSSCGFIRAAASFVFATLFPRHVVIAFLHFMMSHHLVDGRPFARSRRRRCSSCSSGRWCRTTWVVYRLIIEPACHGLPSRYG